MTDESHPPDQSGVNRFLNNDSDRKSVLNLMERRRTDFQQGFATYLATVRRNPQTLEPLRSRFFIHVDSKNQMSQLLLEDPHNHEHTSFNFAQGIVPLDSKCNQWVIFPITTIFKPGVLYSKYGNNLSFNFDFRGYDIYDDHISTDISPDTRTWWTAYPIRSSSTDYIPFMTMAGVIDFLDQISARGDVMHQMSKLDRAVIYNGTPDEREILLGVLTNTDMGKSFLTDHGIDLSGLSNIDPSTLGNRFERVNGGDYRFKGWNT